MKITLLLVILISLSCGKTLTYSDWADGDFHVYTTKDRPKLGIYAHPGYLNLVPEEVIAIGSNDLWIVARQYDHASKTSDHYYIVNKKTEYPDGPLNEKEYEKFRNERALPSFTWFNEPDL